MEQTAQLQAAMLGSRGTSNRSTNWLGCTNDRGTNRSRSASALLEQVAGLARGTLLNHNNLLGARSGWAWGGTSLLGMTAGHGGHHSYYSKANHVETPIVAGSSSLELSFRPHESASTEPIT